MTDEIKEYRLNWNDDEYLEQLHKHRTRIKDGQKLILEDSEQTGNKYTHASWGLCSREQEQDKTLPLYRKGKCPFDKRIELDQYGGCFYHCRLFKGPRPNKKEALELYQIQIDRTESK